MRACSFQYRVEPTGNRWQISFCHADHGKFDRRRDAVKSALRDAERVHRMGHEVSVAVARPEARADLADRVLHPRTGCPTSRKLANEKHDAAIPLVQPVVHGSAGSHAVGWADEAPVVRLRPSEETHLWLQ